jgi:hypothetical protein
MFIEGFSSACPGKFDIHLSFKCGGQESSIIRSTKKTNGTNIEVSSEYPRAGEQTGSEPLHALSITDLCKEKIALN